MPKVESASLHILTITPFYPAEGDEVSGCFVAESLRHLTKRGVVSSVFAVNSIYHARRKPNYHSPAEWIRYPQWPGNFGLASAGRFVAAVVMKKVEQLHERSPIDLIHAHAALPCGHAAALLSQRLNIPFAVTIHGLDVFNCCLQDGIAADWRRRNSLRVYRSARRVICVSDRVRRVLSDGGAGVSAEVVYNGTDPDLFAPDPAREDTATILIVANLLAVKGHELVLRAFASIKDSHPGLRVSIIGEGPDRERFAGLAKSLGVDNRVYFQGRVGRAKVAQAMQSCSIFVMPSRFEGLGCVYLEAMACGKPVVGCHGQGIEEIIRHGDNGWLIPADGLEELVQALQLLLEDANLRARIGQAARRTILDRFTLAHQAECLHRIYEDAAR